MKNDKYTNLIGSRVSHKLFMDEDSQGRCDITCKMC